MTVQAPSTPMEDPVYRAALRHFQLGEWEPGLIELDKLIESYPLEPELRLLRQEMRLRAGVDEDERQDIARHRRERIKRTAGRLFVLIVIVGVIAWGGVSYFMWFQQQFATAQTAMVAQAQELESAVRLRDARSLLAAGRPNEAISLLRQVEEADPEYPGLAETLELAEEAAAVDADYLEAMRRINLQDYQGALVLLESVQASAPNYKGVALQIQNLRRRFTQDDVLVKANAAYDSEQWEDAAAGYETVRSLDPGYQPEVIEERLYRSYLNAATAALSADTETMQAVEIADGYFRKALALRPQDPELQQQREQAQAGLQERLYNSYIQEAQAILIEEGDSLEALAQADAYFEKALAIRPDDERIGAQREMAALYVAALGAFNNGKWADVVYNLETIYAIEPDYALGAARQTLYEAYIARGDEGMVSGAFETALADYQRAAILAQDDPDSIMRLYEAQLKVAEALGALSDYPNAVRVYQTAVEEAALRETVLVDEPDLVHEIDEADRYAALQNYWRAYRIYRDATRSFHIMLAEVNHTVESGEYLTQIANRYNTTVDAILSANDITGKGVAPGTKLVIPTYDK